MGAAVSREPVRVLAPNPGPMTLEGTNTWVLAGTTGSVVIDPGPLDEAHLAAAAEAATAIGPVSAVLLTHGHADHTEGVRRFVELVGGPPVRAYDRAFGEPLDDDSEVEGVRVVHVPGHTADSLAFWLPAERVLFSGDTVLGRGTSVVADPDGALGPYLMSLRRLHAMASAGEIARILPGHGPVVDDPLGVLDFYLAHRAERLEQVRAAVAAGARSARQVVERVYADVDPVLWGAAERSVRAQLTYLRSRSGDQPWSD